MITSTIGILSSMSKSKPFSFTLTVAENDTITIPHSDDPNYIHDYDIDYGDGSVILHVSSYNDPNTTHTYTVAGTYQIKINGVCETFSMNFDTTDLTSKIISVDSWGVTGNFKVLSFYNGNYDAGCYNLLTLPNENGKLINVESFSYTFGYCESLTIIPSGLFDNNFNANFFYTFFYCTSLTTIPSGLFNSNINVTDFSWTFGLCTSLTTIPSVLFDNNINVTSFASTFRGCKSLTSIPSGLFDNNINVTNFNSTFYSCRSLTAIPSGLFDNNFNANFFYTFSHCISLATIPTGLFDNNINTRSFNSTFETCTSLTTIPTGLFDYNINVTDFRWTFGYCTSLTGLAPELWLRTNPMPDGSACFRDDTNLSNYSSIPSNWK